MNSTSLNIARKVPMLVSSCKTTYYAHIPYTRPKTERSSNTLLRDDKYTFLSTCFDTALEEKAIKVSYSCDLERNGILVECIMQMVMASEYANDDGILEYVERFIVRRLNNTYQRVRRAFQKVNIHHETSSYFNHFVTQSYNSDIFSSEEEFERKYKKCLQNFATRRGWRYILKSERAPETGRLHFHAVMHIPYGQLPGGTVHKSSVDRYAMWRRTERDENQFFLENFGINDFELIATADLKPGGKIIDYIVKYCLKDNIAITYSRGLVDVIRAVIDLDNDVLMTYEDGGITKYLLFDNRSPYAKYMNRYAESDESRLDNLIGMYKSGLWAKLRAA